jgi:hypothetical protein
MSESDGDLISVSEIARLHGKHKSAVHKLVARLGLNTSKMKAAELRGQVATYISTADYRLLVPELSSVEDDDSSLPADALTPGVFYLVQLEPQHDPGRFKVGFASDISQRLRAHKTAAPLAVLIKTWPSKLLWEKTAIDCVTLGCERLHTEVFRATDLGAVSSRADAFFALLPPLAGTATPSDS